jgi:hypothetical protein
MPSVSFEILIGEPAEISSGLRKKLLLAPLKTRFVRVPATRSPALPVLTKSSAPSGSSAAGPKPWPHTGGVAARQRARPSERFRRRFPQKIQDLIDGIDAMAPDELRGLAILGRYLNRFSPQDGDRAGRADTKFYARPRYLHDLDFDVAADRDRFSRAPPQD